MVYRESNPDNRLFCSFYCYSNDSSLVSFCWSRHTYESSSAWLALGAKKNQ